MLIICQLRKESERTSFSIKLLTFQNMKVLLTSRSVDVSSLVALPLSFISIYGTGMRYARMNPPKILLDQSCNCWLENHRVIRLFSVRDKIRCLCLLTPSGDI